MTDPVPGALHPNPADDLVILADVVGTLKAHGFLVLGPDGHYSFANPSTGEILAEITAVETVLVNHGLKVPDNIDRIIKALPVLLPLLGVQ